MSRALLVFAKVPRPGHVKTRLTPVLTPAAAARLYTAFLRDALRQYERLDAAVRLYVAPPLPEDGLVGVPNGVSVHEQTGEGLGERMKNAFRDGFEAGYEQLIVVGTDHPTLPSAFLDQGFEALAGGPCISIGPSVDGGFYLLGMNAPYPVLFDEMSYSHEHVFSDTVARAGETDASVAVLPEWYDVDTPQALRRLLDDLERADGAVPNTRRIISTLNLRDRLSKNTSE
jgi:rSAM/selenodomain-associated transferase 1